MASTGEGLWRFREPPAALLASRPDHYVAQHLVPLFHDRGYSSVGKPDREIRHERDFWEGAPQNLFSVIFLREYYLCDWFPRTPGVFWTRQARDARDSVYGHDQGYDPELGNYLLPQAKMSLVEDGGIGNVRLLPKAVDGVRCWFATAIKVCNAGNTTGDQRTEFSDRKSKLFVSNCELKDLDPMGHRSRDTET